MPAAAFAAASYVVWFGAVRFMYETEGAVKGRAWIASFDVQMPKFYLQCLCLHVLLRLPLPLACVVLVFQMVVFVVTDSITPNFSHSLQASPNTLPPHYVFCIYLRYCTAR